MIAYFVAFSLVYSEPHKQVCIPREKAIGRHLLEIMQPLAGKSEMREARLVSNALAGGTKKIPSFEVGSSFSGSDPALSSNAEERDESSLPPDDSEEADLLFKSCSYHEFRDINISDPEV